METVLSDEMRVLEENAEHLGVSRLTLMENAGRAVADEVEARAGAAGGLKVVVAAGPGNNGGDGAVAARHLAARGARVTVVAVGKPGTAEAAVNFETLENLFLSVEIIRIKDPGDIAKAGRYLDEADVIVDALLGTGLRGAVREPIKSLIERINACRGLKVAVDVPSGLDADTGEIHGVCVKADVTVTFHAVKPGLLNAKENVGELVVKDIGIPPEAWLLVGPGDVRKVVKPRPDWSKKGDFGRIIVVGGSKEYSGAPAIAGLAALRAGADLAIIMAPEPAARAIRGYSPNLIVRELPGDYLGLDHVDAILETATKATAILLGPGLGLQEETVAAVLELVEKAHVKLVLDADAIKALSRNPGCLKERRAVLTPHAGELKILTGLELPRSIRDRMTAVEKAASILKTTLIVKGFYDVISDGARTRVNATGNPYMTVGGTGDALAGVTAAMLSLTEDVFEAACVAAYLNGLAGDIAVRGKGGPITATDVLDAIPRAIASARGRADVSLGYRLLFKN